MTDIKEYVNELYKEHELYLEENIMSTKETFKEMVPEDENITEEDKKKNSELTEKAFYLLTLEYQIRGALGALGLIKNKLEVPQHAEAIN